MKRMNLGWLVGRVFLSLLLLTALPAFASEHGGGASGPEPLPFVVNVGNSVETMRVLQVTIVLDFASPEVAHRVSEIKPKVQHRIILLLSSETIENLQTVKGKQDLQAKISKELNGLIEEQAETGIKDVFFTNFILQ